MMKKLLSLFLAGALAFSMLAPAALAEDVATAEPVTAAATAETAAEPTPAPTVAPTAAPTATPTATPAPTEKAVGTAETAALDAYNLLVYFNANGGSVNPNSKRVSYEYTYGEMPTPQRTGYKFLGWYDQEDNKILSDTHVWRKYEHTLWAKWEQSTVKVNLDANGGNVSPNQITPTVDQNYNNLPNPTRGGYNFLGWYTDRTGGTKVDNNTKVTNKNEHTLYAHWVNIAQVYNFVTRLYRICFNREPDGTGLTNWTNVLLNGSQTGAQV
ncbi:MAG: InlB B-repeat-containing protein, partial [Gemmiger sp.]|nr:InlB B-repeat-containing protein [Gemmiger sp.]